MPKQSSNPKVVTKKHLARLERERRQINLIRWIGGGAVAIVILLVGYGFLKLNVLSKYEPVAEVNGVKITTEDWQQRVRLERVSLYNQLSRYLFFQESFGMDTTQQQQSIQAQLSSTDSIGQSVLDTMIDEVLVRQEAEKRGLTASADEVETLMQESYAFYPNGSPTPTLTPTEIVAPTLSSEQLKIYPPTSTPTAAPTATLDPNATPDLAATATSSPTPALPTPTFVPEAATATSTPYTLESYQKQYDDTLTEFKGYDISEKTLRNVYEIQILRQKLQKDIAKDLPHTEVQVLVRHVLVESEDTANQVYTLLTAGEDFAKVAKDFSTDTGSASSGGVYDWAPASNYVPEFKEAALTQKIGEIGKPVKTQYGYHVIQVIGREELPLSDSQFEQTVQTAYNDWLTAAREAATKTVNDVWKTRVPTEPVLTQQ